MIFLSCANSSYANDLAVKKNEAMPGPSKQEMGVTVI